VHQLLVKPDISAEIWVFGPVFYNIVITGTLSVLAIRFGVITPLLFLLLPVDLSRK
jgi:hypothetical protein